MKLHVNCKQKKKRLHPKKTYSMERGKRYVPADWNNELFLVDSLSIWTVGESRGLIVCFY